MVGEPTKHVSAGIDSQGWLLLMHQLPPRPAYLRVKVWRKLREAGAVALRNSGYILPLTDQTVTTMRETVTQIERGGGQAALCKAQFIVGVSEEELRKLFNSARDADYAELEGELRKFDRSKPKSERLGDVKVKLEKASQRLKGISSIDFFEAKGRARAESLLARLEHSFIARSPLGGSHKKVPTFARGKIWVTRRNIHVDRIACTWLIRRFIDPTAKFKFVGDKKYRGSPNELRFDMPDAEFTHEGDNWSFETILDRFSIDEPALRAIGKIIHDLDLKDGKYGRPETSGIGHIVDGIYLTQRNDMDRVSRGAQLFDDVYERFKSAT